MSCLIKNIPFNITLASGNRGINFPYNQCELPPEEICFISVDVFGVEVPLNQENEDDILLKCIE